MRITFKQLMVFNAIAKTGQVAKAAKWVNLSAPATSMALSELEKQLDTPLFERRCNKLLLNAQGRLLIPLACDVLDKVGQIECAFSQHTTALSGHLTVNASSTIGDYILAAAAVKFCALHPQTYIEVNIGNTQDAITSVIEGRSEMAFIEGHCLDKRLTVELWHQDRLQIFCAPNNPFANNQLTAKKLFKKQWVLREEGSGTREVFVNAAMELNMQPIEAFCFSRQEAIKLAVKQGAGLGVLSELALKQEFERNELSPIFVQGLSLTRPFFRIRQHARQVSALGKAFSDYCDEFVKDF